LEVDDMVYIKVIRYALNSLGKSMHVLNVNF